MPLLHDDEAETHRRLYARPAFSAFDSPEAAARYRKRQEAEDKLDNLLRPWRDASDARARRHEGAEQFFADHQGRARREALEDGIEALGDDAGARQALAEELLHELATFSPAHGKSNAAALAVAVGRRGPVQDLIIGYLMNSANKDVLP